MNAAPAPVLTFDQAEGVGSELFDRWGSIAGAVTPPLARESLAWGDLVQFVLRRAGEIRATADAEPVEQPEPKEWR